VLKLPGQRLLAVFAATALLCLGTATSALAVDTDVDDTDAGTMAYPTDAVVVSALRAKGDPPDFSTCKRYTTTLVDTCFQWVGDDQFLHDRVANDWRGAVHTQTNYGKDRFCGSVPSAEGWAVCKYDHREGKCVRMRTYEVKGGVSRNFSAWSPWYGTEYGSPC